MELRNSTEIPKVQPILSKVQPILSKVQPILSKVQPILSKVQPIMVLVRSNPIPRCNQLWSEVQPIMVRGTIRFDPRYNQSWSKVQPNMVVGDATNHALKVQPIYGSRYNLIPKVQSILVFRYNPRYPRCNQSWSKVQSEIPRLDPQCTTQIGSPMYNPDWIPNVQPRLDPQCTTNSLTCRRYNQPWCLCNQPWSEEPIVVQGTKKSWSEEQPIMVWRTTNHGWRNNQAIFISRSHINNINFVPFYNVANPSESPGWLCTKRLAGDKDHINMKQKGSKFSSQIFYFSTGDITWEYHLLRSRPYTQFQREVISRCVHILTGVTLMIWCVHFPFEMARQIHHLSGVLNLDGQHYCLYFLSKCESNIFCQTIMFWGNSPFFFNKLSPKNVTAKTNNIELNSVWQVQHNCSSFWLPLLRQKAAGFKTLERWHSKLNWIFIFANLFTNCL
jgi:hypothetical protein